METSQAIEGKGLRVTDQQLVTLGNGNKLHDGTAMDPELAKRMVESRPKTVISLFVDGQGIGLIAIQDAPKASLC